MGMDNERGEKSGAVLPEGMQRFGVITARLDGGGVGGAYSKDHCENEEG